MAGPRLPFLPIDENGRVANDPLGHYKASDLATGADPKYYGNITIDGAWYILKMSAGGTTLRYCAGITGYPAAWANRESLGYDYFDIIF